MQEYYNKICAQCGEKFEENDNIAICPDCGTPIHKDCWNGHCPNEAKHKDGFDWNKSEATEAYKKIADITTPASDKKACEICGEAADDDMIHCPDCGAAMHRSCYASKGSCPNEENHGKKTSDHGLFHEDGLEMLSDIASRSLADYLNDMKKNPIKNPETGEELTCYGAKQSELITFLGEEKLSTPYRIRTYLRMANTKHKASFNFFAGLLMPYYQLNQRMLGPAMILLLLNIILNMPSFIYALNLWINTTSASVMEMTGFNGAIEILSYIGLAVQIAVAFFHDYIHMRWAAGKILQLREKYKDKPENMYEEALANAGLPNFNYVILGFAITTVFSLIIIKVCF